MKKTFTLSVLIVLMGLSLSNCSRVPLTGRSQLSLVPENEMVSLSLTQYQQFLSENSVSADATNTAMVQRCGKKIAAAVEEYLRQHGLESRISDFNWEFNLVESKEPNAWCMAGGKVVVYTGLLPIAQNEAGLAVVLSHEIAHAVARHGSERMSQQLALQYGGVALSAVMANQSGTTQSLVNQVYGIGGNLGVLAYSRTHEYEADKMGIIFMSMAGYDPSIAVNFWQRMSQMAGASDTPEILRTHPLDENRIAAIQQILPDALEIYNRSQGKGRSSK
ncbi:MAG: M48 family metallopeptidase [Bacteroidales bacterium]